MFSRLKIGSKVYVLVAVLLLISSAGFGFAVYQMTQIGAEIEEIAEQDIPLTESITSITTHQLEQAILLERGLAIGGELAGDPSKLP